MRTSAGWLVHREPLDQSRADADADDRTEKPAERSVPSIKSEPTLTAQWQQQLRMYPDSKYGLDVIDLTGNVVVQIPENEAGIAADSVTVWMDSADQALSKPAQSKRAGSATPAVERQELSGGKSDSSNPLPRRLLADGNVRFSNPEITGNTDRLVAWFEQAPTRPARGPAAASGRAGERRWQMARFSSEAPLPPSRDLRLRPTSLRLFAEDTSASADAAPPLPVDAVRESDRDPRGETGSGDAPDEPVRVRSKLIQLRIVKYGDDPPEVAEFLTEGNVELRQTRKPGQPETVLTGEQLHVTNRSEQEQDIHVFGSPARLSDPALELSGDHLSLFRSQNLMVVDGPGALKLTVDRDFEGNVLETPEELTVQWVEQMSFDGQVAEFVGRVAASMKQSSMRCKQMTVTMTERMQFMDDEDVERPDVDRIVCRYQVEVDSHKVEDGVLMQVVRARFAQFALDQQTGRAEALGPGVVRRWGRGTGETAGLGPLAEVGANAGAEARRDGWEFTRIEFASRMIAQTEKKTMTFFGPVDVLYGPVDEPLESIDIDHLPRQGGLMSCDELDVLQRKLTNGQEYVELLAQGNATLEGRTFSAQSHEITYDGAKKLYTLRSRGDQHAVLVRKRRDGRRTRVVASAFRFIPSQDYFEVEKASVIQRVK